MTKTSIVQDLQYTIDLARSAGQMVGPKAGKLKRLTKTHDSTTDETVTEADRASQRLIIAGLRKRFPDDGVIGEETELGDGITNEKARSGGRVWVIDPIDGTNNFVAGLGAFAVSIGLLDEGKPLLGVVYDVARDQMYAAAVGHGAYLGNQQVSAPTSDVAEGSILMMTCNITDAHGRIPRWPVRWLSQNSWKLRMLGSAALEAVAVAAGVAHGAVTINSKLWDIAGAAAILQEAGAVLTDHRGKNIFPFDVTAYAGAKVPFIAAGPQAHATLLKELVRFP